MTALNQRKGEHLSIVAQDASMDREKHYFNKVRLMHRALPEIDLTDVDPSTELLGKKLTFPFLISSMTGGSGEQFMTINRNLAEAAEAEGVAMGVGSQRVLFSDLESKDGFDLRAVAPTVPLFANLGAVQLNDDVTQEQVQSAVDVLQADALILHFNPLQEAVQPEGDTCFSGLHKKIKTLVENLPVPVIAKEVGAGISRTDAELLMDAGVQIIDVAGAGGTSWSRIESSRVEDSSLGECFKDWGIPTPDALKNLSDLNVTLIASGGVRTGIDMVKAIILGASLCGMARPLMAPAMESADAVRKEIQRVKKEFVTAMFLLGAEKIDQIYKNGNLIF